MVEPWPELPRLVIGPLELELVERQAIAAYPEECCGLLVGSEEADGAVRVGWVEPCDNRAPNHRRRRFLIAPESLLAAYRRARARGRQVVGTYHSHPGGGAVPSPADLESAWPGASYLILGLGPDGVEESRGWQLTADRRFVEQQVIS